MKLLIIFILRFYCICCIQAASRYVDGTIGNDNNNGLSISAAYKTVQKCASTAVAGG